MRLDSASALFSFLELEEACLIWTPAPMFVTELLQPNHTITFTTPLFNPELLGFVIPVVILAVDCQRS